MRRLADKLAAVLKRDLITSLRYRAGFAMGIVGTVGELVAFYFLARAIGPGFRPDGQDYFPFLLVGTGLYTFLVAGVSAFLATVQEAQQTGTLEVLMTTPTPPAVLVVLSAASSFAGKAISLVLYLILGFALFGVAVHPNVIAVLAILVLSAMVAVSLGIFAAALQVATQKGSAVIWLLSSMWFLTGAMFPVSSLPQPLRQLAELIPITHALSGMRAALLGTVSNTGLGQHAAIQHVAIQHAGVLALWAALLLPLSVLTFSWVLRRSRMAGTLSFY